MNNVTHLGRIIDNGFGKVDRHKDNVINRINKARGSFMKYLHNVWNNSFVNLDLKIKLFNSLVMSVLMYSMETIPSLKTFETRLKTFTISCYKRILRIHKDVEIKEKDLSEIIGIYTVDKHGKFLFQCRTENKI